MSVFDRFIEESYSNAKNGKWNRVLEQWHQAPLLARRSSRYQKESSGWTFLHQAAYFGNEIACRELIRLGAAANTLSKEGQTPADVAEEKRNNDLAALLQKACEDDDSSWACPADPDLLPSSRFWDEADERHAIESLFVSYAKGVVWIPYGARYFVDSLDRILIGWHGSYDPPRGMDGESMVRHAERR